MSKTIISSPETALPIKGFESLYSALADGRIFSDRRGIFLAPHVVGTGYLAVTLQFKAVRKSYLVHRLVCEAFHGSPSFFPSQVNHKDGVKANNRPENLEWVTASQNRIHADLNGLAPNGERSHLCTKLTKERVLQIIALKGLKSQTAIGKEFGVSQSLVWRIFNNKAWAHLSKSVA